MDGIKTYKFKLTDDFRKTALENIENVPEELEWRLNSVVLSPPDNLAYMLQDKIKNRILLIYFDDQSAWTNEAIDYIFSLDYFLFRVYAIYNVYLNGDEVWGIGFKSPVGTISELLAKYRLLWKAP